MSSLSLDISNEKSRNRQAKQEAMKAEIETFILEEKINSNSVSMIKFLITINHLQKL